MFYTNSFLLIMSDDDFDMRSTGKLKFRNTTGLKSYSLVWLVYYMGWTNLRNPQNNLRIEILRIRSITLEGEGGGGRTCKWVMTIFVNIRKQKIKVHIKRILKAAFSNKGRTRPVFIHINFKYQLAEEKDTNQCCRTQKLGTRHT